MIEIYTDEITERAIYTFNFVLADNGINFRFNNDFKSFEKSTLPRLNYSEREFNDTIQLKPCPILFDEEVKKYTLSKSHFLGEDCLEINNQCDPFGAVFFVLSRLEEYGEAMKDEHDRFSAKQSIQYQFGWLQRMVCERWSMAIHKYLFQNKLIDQNFQKRNIEIIPTFDIDNAFAYKWKEGSRQYLSTAKDILRRNKKRITERKAVLSGKEKDPYDTFDYINSIALRGFKTTVFWLLGDYGHFDKNIFHGDKRQQDLIRNMGANCNVGIHPSYNSNYKKGQLRTEIERLKTTFDKSITLSRQHFLKLKLPNTYKELLQNGIEHDYTMGFASEVGFRAGTSRPFRWFNLDKNYTTDLWIHPFAYMDGTLLEYKHLSIHEAKQIISSLHEEFKQFGGEFIFIWHNETIGNYGKWEGWQEVLEHTLNLKNNE